MKAEHIVNVHIDAVLNGGLSIDEFASRLSLFFDMNNDFFEEMDQHLKENRI